MQDRRLVFPERNVVELLAHRAPDPEAGQVRVRSTLSLMSTGTENIVLTGDFAAGTHFSWFGTLPFHPGYLTVGVVDAAGEEVTGLEPGTRVFHRAGHGSRFTLSADAVTPVPAQIGDDEAVWAGLAKVAFRAARAAPLRPGDRVVVIGAGPIGQMAVRWAVAAGCHPVVAVSRTARRLEFAARGGATHLVQAPVEHAGEQVHRAMGSRSPVVIDTTGNPAVFEHALRLADWHGTVILLGDTGYPAQQRLTSDVMVKGLVVTAVHDQHHWHGGDEATVLSLVMNLMASGRMDCSELITHRFSPANAAAAYRLANDRRAETVGIVFDWSAHPATRD